MSLALKEGELRFHPTGLGHFGAIAVFALAKTAKTWSSWLPASVSQALSLSLSRTSEQVQYELIVCNGIARFLNAGDTRINLGRNPDSKGAIWCYRKVSTQQSRKSPQPHRHMKLPRTLPNLHNCPKPRKHRTNRTIPKPTPKPLPETTNTTLETTVPESLQPPRPRAGSRTEPLSGLRPLSWGCSGKNNLQTNLALIRASLGQCRQNSHYVS